MATIDGVDMSTLYPSGTLPYPEDMRPGFEFSEHVKITGDKNQWLDELTKAQAKVSIARDKLNLIADLPVPATREEYRSPQHRQLRDNIRHALRIVNAGPDERPRFSPDGTMYAEDAAKLAQPGDWAFEPGMRAAEPSAAVHIETVTFRLPRSDMKGRIKTAALDDAREATQNFTHALTYSDAGKVGLDRPDAKKALEFLDQVDEILTRSIDEGRKTKQADGIFGVINRLNDRIWSLTPKQAAWTAVGIIAGGFAVSGAIAGYAAYHNDR